MGVGPPDGTALSLGFGAVPVAPPTQGVVRSPHIDRLTELALRLSQKRPSGLDPWWYLPFVGLWGFPRLPAGAKSCTSPSHRSVLRVGLTAFPGRPALGPIHPLAARDGTQSTIGLQYPVNKKTSLFFATWKLSSRIAFEVFGARDVRRNARTRRVSENS